MAPETAAILGIPIDNVSMDEAVDKIFAMINDYGMDGESRYVATVNVDFVVNTLTWRLSRIRHPELLNILRRSDLVVADGMPIVWISRILGSPLKERVTGADLVPRLAEEAAAHQKSIYFLGGRRDSGKHAAAELKTRYPGLMIAGIDASYVHIEGEALAGAIEEDIPIVERINNSGADILLIGFGNPKQEIWFERNRSRLKIPVSIGVGGTYEFITGSVARAPEWMQRIGLEWAFRITQEPRRLWKRYFVGFLKFGLMILPAFLYHRYTRARFNLHHGQIPVPDQKYPAAEKATEDPIKVVRLPDPLDMEAVERIKDEIQRNLAQTPNTILDFSHVTFIDSSGLGLLLMLWRQAEKEHRGLYLSGLGQTARRIFELSRMNDLFKDRIYATINEVAAVVKATASLPTFHYSEEIRPNYVLFRLSGTLDATRIAKLNVDEIMDSIGCRNCILDLTNLTFVDSSGLIFFLKIQKHVSKHNKTCSLFGPQENTLKMFHITKLDRLMNIEDDIPSAELSFEGSIQ